MKFLLLLILSTFALGATESPFLSYDREIKFDSEFIKIPNFTTVNNSNSNSNFEINDCINIWRNCVSEELCWSLDIVGPGDRGAEFVNITITSGVNPGDCRFIMYQQNNLPTTYCIPLSSFNYSGFCDFVSFPGYTVNIQYKWGPEPGEYCYVNKIFPVCP